MICEKKTSKFPNGRTGTEAGEAAHRRAKEKPCKACAEARNQTISRRNSNKTQTAPWRQPYTMERACDERTPQFLFGKRGTYAGSQAHARAKEEPCPECLVARREYGKKNTKRTYDRYREKKLAYMKKYREENRERIEQWRKDYYRLNPGKSSQSWRTRRARLRDLPSEVYTEADITRLYGNTCYLCAQPVDLSIQEGPRRRNIEHLIPISHPDCPGDLLSNVRWSHSQCNLLKGDSLMEDVADLFPDMINPYKLGELTNA